MEETFADIIERIYDQDSRYKPDAYEFVMEALNFTQKKLKCQRHITGEEMLMGIRELLMKKFGPLTITVLQYWGIKSTEDFGHIVFNLVENHILSKTEQDSIDTFRNAYDLSEVFTQGYRQRLHKQVSRMRSM